MSAVDRVKYGTKVAIAYTLYALGLLQLCQFVVLRRKAVVLMYHRVLTKEEQRRTASHPAIVVGRDTFEKQMAFLKRRFAVLSVADFAERMERKVPFPHSSCLITFDDGWRDTFSNAFPILDRYGLPAVVFLPVNYIGTRRLFWQEALVHLGVRAVLTVRADPARHARLRQLLAAVRVESILDLIDEDPRPAIIREVSRQKGTAVSVIERTVKELARELDAGVDADVTDGFLDWPQVEAMSRRGIAFGAHGAEHLLLTHVSHEEAASEIRTAYEVMSNRLDRAALAFSYPNGYVNADVMAMVEKAGYRLAFITSRGFVRCDDHRYAVRRLNIHENVTRSMPMFLARIVGLF